MFQKFGILFSFFILITWSMKLSSERSTKKFIELSKQRKTGFNRQAHLIYSTEPITIKT